MTDGRSEAEGAIGVEGEAGLKGRSVAGSPRATIERGEMLAEVCNAVVHIHKRFYGKGPTKARAHLTQDLLTVVLEGGFTTGEQTLQQRGHESEVLRSRIVMQHSVEEVFCEAIEGIVGRAVRSFMSANDPAGNLQAEIFVFHSGRSGASGRADVPDGELADDGPAPEGPTDDDLSERARHARERHRVILDEHKALRSEQQQSRRAIQEERGRLNRPHDA